MNRKLTTTKFCFGNLDRLGVHDQCEDRRMDGRTELRQQQRRLTMRAKTINLTRSSALDTDSFLHALRRHFMRRNEYK